MRGRLLGAALFGESGYADEIAARLAAPPLAGTATLDSFSGDVSEALKDVDIVVNASVIAEPFGQVVVEAIANGVPVVVPDQGGPAEIVEDGLSGLTYGSGDTADLAATIARLAGLPDLYERLSAGGLRRAEVFSPRRSRRSSGSSPARSAASALVSGCAGWPVAQVTVLCRPQPGRLTHHRKEPSQPGQVVGEERLERLGRTLGGSTSLRVTSRRRKCLAHPERRRSPGRPSDDLLGPAPPRSRPAPDGSAECPETLTTGTRARASPACGSVEPMNRSTWAQGLWIVRAQFES